MRRRPPYHSLQWRHLPPDASFIAHLSHANRQPHGTASNVTGLPHLQVVTCVEITLSRVHLPRASPRGGRCVLIFMWYDLHNVTDIAAQFPLDDKWPGFLEMFGRSLAGLLVLALIPIAIFDSEDRVVFLKAILG